MIDRATNGLSEFFYLIRDSFCILLLFDTLSKTVSSPSAAATMPQGRSSGFFLYHKFCWEGHGGLYEAPTMEERRKRKVKRREVKSSLLIFDLKDGKL